MLHADSVTRLTLLCVRCVGGGRNLDSYGVAGSRAAVSWSVSYSSACSNTDSRWTKIDERTSQSFLQDNFDTQCSAATGNVIDWNDLTAVSVSGTNYYIYGERDMPPASLALFCITAHCLRFYSINTICYFSLNAIASVL